jgi:nascent polypeptide-associated complex subunit beta
MEGTLQDKVLAARAKLAQKFGDAGAQLGGRGTERRKKKTTHKTTINDDKKLKSLIKKFNVHPLPEIGEVNMFKDDGSVLHFKEPEGKRIKKA